MPCQCSQCAGIEDQFNDAEARKKLRQFRRRGPDRTTKLLIDAIHGALESRELRESVLLDVGAGIGVISNHARLAVDDDLVVIADTYGDWRPPANRLLPRRPPALPASAGVERGNEAAT